MSIGYIPKKLKYRRKRRRMRKKWSRRYKSLHCQGVTTNSTKTEKKKLTFLERIRTIFK